VRGVGTLVNVAAVIAGCVAGLLAGARLPERIRATILNGVGLLVLLLLVRAALDGLISIIYAATLGSG